MNGEITCAYKLSATAELETTQREPHLLFYTSEHQEVTYVIYAFDFIKIYQRSKNSISYLLKVFSGRDK